MLGLVIAFSMVGPVFLACLVVLVAFSLQSGVPTLSGIVFSGFLVSVAPMVATASVSLLCRWCFRSVNTRPVSTAAGVCAFLAVLSDSRMLQGVARVFDNDAFTVAQVVRVAGDASAVGCLSAAVVMFAALLVELPARWFVTHPEARELQWAFQTLRWVSSGVVLVLGWTIISESAGDRLSELMASVISE